MNWIRQNSFLAAFFAITTVVAIVLSVLLYLQYDKYSAVADQFTNQSAELKRLQGLSPYPSEDNLKKLSAQKLGVDASITNLQAQLIKMELPSEPATPEQFQDRLRASVVSTVELARQNGVKLPEKFYLGFDGYETLPPKPEATKALAKQMAGIELVFKDLLANKITQLDSIKRSPLIEEDQKGSSQKPAPALQAQKGPVQKSSFEVGFKAELNQVRRILNTVVKTDNQFFIIRGLQIKNESPKAPTKKETEEAKVGSAASEPGKSTTGEAQPTLKFILGAEKVDVVAQIEIVNFKITPVK
jgi:hypothetical protein